MGSNQSKPAAGKNAGKNNSNNHEVYAGVPPFNVTDYTSSTYPYPTDNFMYPGPVYFTPATPITPVNSATMPYLYPSASAPSVQLPPNMPYTYPNARTPPAASQLHVEVHELDGHSNITRPPPPPRVRHLSELIDPMDIPPNAHVRSPSGNVLDAEEWAAHPARPRSLRERREEILRRVAEANAAYASGGLGDALEPGATDGAGAGDIVDEDRIEVIGEPATGRVSKKDKIPRKKTHVSKKGGESKKHGGSKKVKGSKARKGPKKAVKVKNSEAARKEKREGFWRRLMCF